MSRTFKVLLVISLFYGFSGSRPLFSQILQDTSSIRLLKNGVDAVYDFRFDEAWKAAGKLSRLYPDHPVIHLFSGMITYWENYPIKPGSKAQTTYVNYMEKCIRICEEREETGDYPEYLLSNLGARGMLLLFYADNNLSNNVFPLVKTTYRYIRQCFDYTSYYDDFYFFTGLYNYYREAYPEARPVYKVLAFLFPRGDRIKGLSEMQAAAQKSLMLRAEAYTFLSHIYIHFENNYQVAYAYSKSLNELYPGNLQYRASKIKNLLLIKWYDEAEKLIKSGSGNSGNRFFEAQVTIYNGILQEKKYHNLKLAKQYYNRGFSEITPFGYFGNETAALACFGLSRIYDLEGDKDNKKTYRKMALDLTSYKKVSFDD